MKNKIDKFMENKGEIIIYQNTENDIAINVRLEDENSVVRNFRTTAQLLNILNISMEMENYTINPTCRNFRQVQIEGNPQTKEK